jgi:predicted ABC-type ATPase
MSDSTPRLRMFAGPNGSGKTTVKNNLSKPRAWFGIYINPDELEKTVRETGFLSLRSFDCVSSTDEILEFFTQSTFLQQQGLAADCQEIVYRDQGLDFGSIAFQSYHASVLADFLRRKALAAGHSLSFETVMSAKDKVNLLGEAQRLGYRTYLYFIATEDPAINIQRVRNRVMQGGHNVSEEKIIARYYRSLELLKAAIPFTNRAYFFDTSEVNRPWYFAEAREGRHIELKSQEIPAWFQPIWEHFS